MGKAANQKKTQSNKILEGGRKEEGREARKQGRKEGRKVGRREARKEGRNEANIK